nr:hypothetical protein [Tanacetum cinerariifolium]
MPVTKTNIYVSNSTSVESSNSVRRPQSKDNKSKKRVLKNNNVKSTSTNVRKFSSSDSIVSNKLKSMNSTVCQSNANVLKAKTVNAINDGSNIVCISCGKDVFMPSHKKYVAHYALSVDSRVKRALFTSPVAAKSRNERATSVATKSRTLINYMKNKIETSRNWHKRFENQSSFNWSPKNKTAQSTPSVSKSSPNLVIWIVDSGYSKHMTSNLQLLRNFIKKFMGIVCFGNDHFTSNQWIWRLCSRQSQDMLCILGPSFSCLIFLEILEDSQSVPSKEDFDNLFGPLYEEYYAMSTTEVSDNFAENTLSNEDIPSSSLIAIEEDEAPQIVTSSEEPIANESTTPVSNENANEPVQKDIAAFEENDFYNPFHTVVLEEAESSLTFYDPSNMHEFYQIHRSADLWTKNHPLEQVIGDPTKPIMIRHILYTDAEMRISNILMFGNLSNSQLAKNNSSQMALKNKTDAENTVIRNKSHLVAKGYGQEESIDFEESFSKLSESLWHTWLIITFLYTRWMSRRNS